MAMSLEEFLHQLGDSGLLPREALDSLTGKDVASVVEELLQRNLLTAYQTQELIAGRGRGLQLGNYRILDKLGQGGMGTVFKAEHRRMERIVALKVVSPAALATTGATERFHQEVKAAAKLSHTNIVHAYDADESEGTHFLVMEFVDGGDLAALVRANGPLPIEQALHFVLQAARGLEYAHERGVIHRDIKPANLLVDERGLVKILDMGLARIDAPGADVAGLTATGQIMGTADYMSPEQALNTRKADQRSDVYSLGITLWYLLTGRTAYDGDTLMERLMAHQTAPLPSLRSVRPAVSPELDGVFQRMIAKTPGERYSTMTEVIASIERCRGEDAGTLQFDPQEASRLRAALRTWTGGTISTLSPGTLTTAANAGRTLTFAAATAETDPQTSAPLPLPVASGNRRRPRSAAPLFLAAIAAALILVPVIYFAWPRTSPAPLSAPRESEKKPTSEGASVVERLTSPDYVWTTPVNLGSVVNSASRDGSPRFTSDECVLVFERNYQIYECRRPDRDAPFSEPKILSGGVNELSGLRAGIALSGDGLWLGVCGRDGSNFEPFFCERKSRDEAFGPPQKFPAPVSSPRWELSLTVSDDTLRLFVTSNRGASGHPSVLFEFSRPTRDQPFGSERELGSHVNDGGMIVGDWVSPDGRLLVSTQMVQQPFTTRMHVRPTLDAEFGAALPFDGPFEDVTPSSPWISPDGERMYFHTRELPGGEGDLDIWMSRRVPRDKS